MKLKITLTAIRYVDYPGDTSLSEKQILSDLKNFTLADEEGITPFIEDVGVELHCTVEKVQS